MSHKPKIKIMPYMINIRIRCIDGFIDGLPELKARGYPVIFKGFRKYKFAVHHRVMLKGNDNLWVVTEISSGIAFTGRFDTRLKAGENAYLQLKTNKEKIVKKIQKFQWKD